MNIYIGSNEAKPIASFSVQSFNWDESVISRHCEDLDNCFGLKKSRNLFSLMSTSVIHITLEKVHSTTLIYRRNLSFNPQPQNQVFNTHELSKSSNLHPLAVFRWFSPTWPPYQLSLLSHFSRAHVSLSRGPPSSSFGCREANTTSWRLVPGTGRQALRCRMTGTSRDAVLPIPPPPPCGAAC
jgi:hypothetical protein